MPQPLMSAPRLVVYVLFSSGFFGRSLFSLLPFFAFFFRCGMALLSFLFFLPPPLFLQPSLYSKVCALPPPPGAPSKLLALSAINRH